MYIYIYIYIYTHTHIYIHIYTHIFTENLEYTFLVLLIRASHSYKYLRIFISYSHSDFNFCKISERTKYRAWFSSWRDTGNLNRKREILNSLPERKCISVSGFQRVSRQTRKCPFAGLTSLSSTLIALCCEADDKVPNKFQIRIYNSRRDNKQERGSRFRTKLSVIAISIWRCQSMFLHVALTRETSASFLAATLLN